MEILTKDELVAAGISPEDSSKVTSLLSEVQKRWMPVENHLDELRKQKEKVKTLTAQLGEMSSDDGSAEALTKTINDLKDQLKVAKAEVKEVRQSVIAETAFKSEAGELFHDKAYAKIVETYKDQIKACVDKDGNVDFSSVIESIKENEPYYLKVDAVQPNQEPAKEDKQASGEQTTQFRGTGFNDGGLNPGQISPSALIDPFAVDKEAAEAATRAAEHFIIK